MVLGKDRWTDPGTTPMVLDRTRTWQRDEIICILKNYHVSRNQGFTCFDKLLTTLIMLLISRHAFYNIYISRWHYTQNEFFAESSSFHLQELDQYFIIQRMFHDLKGPIKLNYYFDPNRSQDRFYVHFFIPYLR